MSDLPLIIGAGKTNAALVFHDIQQSLVGHGNVVLFSHFAAELGEEIPVGSIIYNLEPLYDSCRSFSLGYLDVLKRFPALDYQRKNVEYLKQFGINAVHMPYGYHPDMERSPIIEDEYKDIEVLFVGSLTPRREQALVNLMRAGLQVAVAQNTYMGALDNLIARAKVCVNLHFCDEHPLEVVRLNHMLANKCFVVTEPGWDEEDNQAYAGAMVFADLDHLTETCLDYLGKPEARAEIAARGRQVVRSMDQRRLFDEAMRELNGDNDE